MTRVGELRAAGGQLAKEKQIFAAGEVKRGLEGESQTLDRSHAQQAISAIAVRDEREVGVDRKIEKPARTQPARRALWHDSGHRTHDGVGARRFPNAKQLPEPKRV